MDPTFLTNFITAPNMVPSEENMSPLAPTLKNLQTPEVSEILSPLAPKKDNFALRKGLLRTSGNEASETDYSHVEIERQRIDGVERNGVELYYLQNDAVFSPHKRAHPNNGNHITHGYHDTDLNNQATTSSFLGADTVVANLFEPSIAGGSSKCESSISSLTNEQEPHGVHPINAPDVQQTRESLTGNFRSWTCRIFAVANFFGRCFACSSRTPTCFPPPVPPPTSSSVQTTVPIDEALHGHEHADFTLKVIDHFCNQFWAIVDELPTNQGEHAIDIKSQLWGLCEGNLRVHLDWCKNITFLEPDELNDLRDMFLGFDLIITLYQATHWLLGYPDLEEYNRVYSLNTQRFIDNMSHFQYMRQYCAENTDNWFLKHIGYVGSILAKICLQELYCTIWLSLGLRIDDNNLVNALVFRVVDTVSIARQIYTEKMCALCAFLINQPKSTLLVIQEGSIDEVEDNLSNLTFPLDDLSSLLRMTHALIVKALELAITSEDEEDLERVLEAFLNEVQDYLGEVKNIEYPDLSEILNINLQDPLAINRVALLLRA